MRPFCQLVRREILLAWRDGAAIGVALGFYLIVVTLVPLGVGPDLKLLARIAPGILWIGLLLAALLSLPRMFETDLEDGSLDILASGSLPLEAVAAAKSAAHWVSSAIPLAALSPLAALLLNLDAEAYPVLLASVGVGTPAISFIGSVGAALTLRARRAGVLVALLMLPLFVPTLLFGIEAVTAGSIAAPEFWPAFLILCAISLATLVLGPVAAGAAIRLQLQE